MFSGFRHIDIIHGRRLDEKAYHLDQLEVKTKRGGDGGREKRKPSPILLGDEGLLSRA